MHSTLYFLCIKITEEREFLSRYCFSADYFFPAETRKKNLSTGFINSWPLLAITHVIYVTIVPSSKELPGEGEVEKGNISSEVSHLSWTISAEPPREGIMELWKNNTLLFQVLEMKLSFQMALRFLLLLFFAPFTKHIWNLDSLNCFENLLPLLWALWCNHHYIQSAAVWMDM